MSFMKFQFNSKSHQTCIRMHIKSGCYLDLYEKDINGEEQKFTTEKTDYKNKWMTFLLNFISKKSTDDNKKKGISFSSNLKIIPRTVKNSNCKLNINTISVYDVQCSSIIQSTKYTLTFYYQSKKFI